MLFGCVCIFCIILRYWVCDLLGRYTQNTTKQHTICFSNRSSLLALSKANINLKNLCRLQIVLDHSVTVPKSLQMAYNYNLLPLAMPMSISHPEPQMCCPHSLFLSSTHQCTMWYDLGCLQSWMELNIQYRKMNCWLSYSGYIQLTVWFFEQPGCWYIRWKIRYTFSVGMLDWLNDSCVWTPGNHMSKYRYTHVPICSKWMIWVSCDFCRHNSSQYLKHNAVPTDSI